MKKQSQLIIIHGPTASGKSSLAIKLAKKFNGFLISADSRQVYKRLNIGTNKDAGVWQGGKFIVDGIEMCLVDIVEPNQDFNLSDWLKLAKASIEAHPGQLPIIVGGTGLYTQALIQGFELPAQDLKLRAKLEKQLAEKGGDWLIEKIKKYDPDNEHKIDSSNPHRLIRQAEIILSTKKPLAEKKQASDFHVLQMAILVDRQQLYAKINHRVDQMVNGGLLTEVEALIHQGLNPQLPAMTGIGYRQMVQFLEGKIAKDEAIDLIKRDSRRYAKRQLTWFKRDKSIHWIKDFTEAESLTNDFLDK